MAMTSDFGMNLRIYIATTMWLTHKTSACTKWNSMCQFHAGMHAIMIMCTTRYEQKFLMKQLLYAQYYWRAKYLVIYLKYAIGVI